MSGIRASLAWWCFEEFGIPPEELIDAAADIGYTGFEFAPREQWPLLRDRELDIVAIRGHQSIASGFNDPTQHDRIEREIVDHLAIAAEWSIPILICFSGERHGIDDESGAVHAANGLRRVAKAAEDAGVTLAMELLNSKIDHPDYQSDHTSWGVKVIEWVDSPAVKLLYDIYHMQIMEGDIIRTIGSNHQHFAHYHVAGNPGRNEPDDTQEINYPPIYQAIIRTGYKGYIGMEFVPALNPIESLRAAYELLRDSDV